MSIADITVVLRAMYLLVDAYHSKHVLPLLVVQLLDGLTFPSFIAALISIDRVLVNTMRPGRLQQQHRDRSAIEGIGLTAYLALSVVVYTRASLVPHSRSWIVAAQAVFVTWSLTLFFLLVGRSWELRRTAQSADAVRTLLTRYVRLKRHLASGSENSASSGYGSTAAARRHLRLLRRQMEIVSHDGGFPMTSRRKNEMSATAPSSSSSSSSAEFAFFHDSFRTILSCHDAREQLPSIRVSDSAALDVIDLDDGAASCAVRADGTVSGSEPEVLDPRPRQQAEVGPHYSPTRCSQQTWVFFDNRSSAAPGDQLLAEIASGPGHRAVSDATSGLCCRRHGLRRLWQAFGSVLRRFYEYLRLTAAEWLGLSGQLRLMTQHAPRRSSKSRLARSRSRASNISSGQRSSNYKLAQPDSEFRGPEEQNSQMVTSSSRLSESTCTELSLLSVSVLTGSCLTDDGHEISREQRDRRETGYAADTEPETTRYHGGQHFRWSRDRIRTPPSDQSDNSTSGRRIELPASTTTRCLRMRRHIPDATLLRRSMWAAITVASTTLLVCSLQIYSALGIYGVLSNEQTVKSLWAWLVFQSLSRCVVYTLFHT